MRMWQLVNSHGGSCRAIIAKAPTIDFVVSCEVVHVDKVGRHFDHILELCAHCSQDVAHVVEHGLGLRPNIEMSSSKLINLRASNRVIGASGARAGYKEEIACALDVRILPARLCLAVNNFAFDSPHVALRLNPLQANTNIVQLRIEIQGMHAAFASDS